MKVMSNHFIITRIELDLIDDFILRKRVRNLIDDAKYKYKNIDNLRFFIDAPILDKITPSTCNCTTINDIRNNTLFGIPYFVENVPLNNDVLGVTLKFDYKEIVDMPFATEKPFFIVQPTGKLELCNISIDDAELTHDRTALRTTVMTEQIGWSKKKLSIKDVIFNDPATIVFWSDGTKTVVKVGENEHFDKEKGLAIAISKKFLGTNYSQSNFNDIFKKWIQ